VCDHRDSEASDGAVHKLSTLVATLTSMTTCPLDVTVVTALQSQQVDLARGTAF
jgi:hypothetical protein